ncbi:MAG: hypothetical protein CL433_12750 [Acidimicrobiaceae bacterium]|jgi:DNA-binding MarR family transcriptional regulator|nr:hypothetical protein [Acidimicrobiaceae bacterium]|tara:strand:- start:380 stop:859 length:480 start_codon:yes stop_codon:yes gene_type:complete
MEQNSLSAPDIAAVRSAVQRFQRLRAGKTTHAAVVDAVGVELTQQSLQLLVAAQDGQKASELGRATHMDAAAVSRELRRLENKRLIERSPSPHHHAGVIIHLTEAGRRTREKVIALREGHLTQALAGWRTADVVLFAQMLEQFVTDLQATPLVQNETTA